MNAEEIIDQIARAISNAAALDRTPREKAGYIAEQFCIDQGIDFDHLLDNLGTPNDIATDFVNALVTVYQSLFRHVSGMELPDDSEDGDDGEDDAVTR